MIRVVIADDHQLLLEGISQALDLLPDISVVATAQDGEGLVSAVTSATPDVIVIDQEMPKLTGVGALKKLGSPPPAIIVTMHADEEHRSQAEAAGAVGFLSKSAPLPTLASAVRAAAAGEVFIEQVGGTSILDDYQEAKLDPGAAALTARERELLGLLTQGVSSTEELADRLYISQKTVKNHLASIYEKLAISDRAQAAVEAIRLGIGKR
ncbi:MAG: response regulator transcription factor [Acidimicrobiales bacterium]|nr:response regulator transcription factor [Acidimicrobiia bacterium]NNE96033.1 response regulator transcription factor [Acidimicrobiales bacterium]NNF10590.1 response regulator transcription factor [Acidimicrobiia bacterium]NNL69732.1 response regulator transcription factor [Acidimicrobiia bacterium]